MVSTGDLAKRIGVSRMTVRRWIDCGLIAAHRPAPRRHYRISRDEADRFEDYAMNSDDVVKVSL